MKPTYTVFILAALSCCSKEPMTPAASSGSASVTPPEAGVATSGTVPVASADKAAATAPSASAVAVPSASVATVPSANKPSVPPPMKLAPQKSAVPEKK